MKYLQLDHKYMTRIKLVLGNGFDLACGLDSTYSSFFASPVYGAPIFQKAAAFENDPSGELPEDVSLWDLFFHLVQAKRNSPLGKEAKWKDVEAVMRVALGFKTTGYSAIPYSFDNILEKYASGSEPSSKEETILISAVERRGFPTDEKGFYKALLQELSIFESRFADYIQSKMTPEYQEKARRMFAEIGKLHFQDRQLCSIDTFNYTTPDVFNDWKFFGRPVAVRHVNGSIDGAIFGIDSHEVKLEDPRYRFTKTYRKMNRLAHGGREDHSRYFENVVVYGHSLGEADYSYFFSILRAMDLPKQKESSSRFVFAFSQYSDKVDNADKCCWAALRLLNAYANRIKDPSYIDTLEANDRFGYALVEMP